MTPLDTRNDNVIPGRQELVAHARALQPLLREYAAKTDAGRCLPYEVNAALIDAGFFRLLTPQRFGGYETSLRIVTEVTEALGAGDASAAWLVSIAAERGRFITTYVRSEQRVQPEPGVAMILERCHRH